MQPSTSYLPTRNHGLDTLRACAISLVFMYHYMVFVSHQQTFGWLSEIGWAGVDLFFVLSGYLIGNQVFKGLAQGHRLSLSSFYWRRAWRTLPVFWLVLAAYFFFRAYLGGKAPPPLWRFLTFTQNWGLKPGTAFSHAWSLCIEEQFYLILPLLLVVVAWCNQRCRFKLRREHGWLLLGSLLALGVVARCVLWSRYGLEAFGEVNSYYPNVYYSTLCRFDEFLPGIALALLKNFHPTIWQRLTAHGQKIMLAGLLTCAALFYISYHFYYIDGYGYGFFMSAFGYSLLAFAFALMVLAALSPTSSLSQWRIPGAQSLALWSYSIYLTHKPLAYWIQMQSKTLAWSPAVLLAVITLACLVLGALLYHLLELPCLRLRERWSADLHQPSHTASQPTIGQSI
ncbi:MAG: acyltransferase [Burkholderiales bacterium]|nr:acyltransferase [Burkholderiales bacterium]